MLDWPLADEWVLRGGNTSLWVAGEPGISATGAAQSAVLFLALSSCMELDFPASLDDGISIVGCTVCA